MPPKMPTQRQSKTDFHIEQSILPLYKVILFNDSHNTTIFVAETLMLIFKFNVQTAEAIMWTAHTQGQAVCIIEYFEAAEHHRDCLRSCGLTSSIEPA
jgi:ATP-dependent Clp protease adaptor protein ClpS